MTVSDLRVLVDNLEEYIHVPGGIDRLKKTILHLAVSGKLVPQDPSEGTGEELYQQIQTEKQKLVAEGKLKKQKLLSEITEDEIPFQAPSSWKWSKLDTIVNLITDGTHHTPQYIGTGVPFLSIKDISGGSLDFSRCKYISKNEYEEINQRCNPENGDILFCRIGTLGRPVVVNTDEAFSIFVSLGLIKFNQKLILSKYLKLYLESPQAYTQYSQIMAGGSHTNKLNLVSMKSLFKPLPPKAEQGRIVEKVDSIFALIDELAVKYVAEQQEREKLVGSSLAHLAKGQGGLALNHLAEIIRTKSDAAQIRKTILHLAVSGQLVPQDPSEGTGEQLLIKILAEKAKLVKEGKIKKQKPLPEITRDEIPFEIPGNWRWARLGDVATWKSGLTPAKDNMSSYSNRGIPFVKIGDLNDGLVEDTTTSITQKALEENNLPYFPKGTIMLAMYMSIGKLGILGINASTNQSIVGGVLVKSGALDTHFLFSYLLSARSYFVSMGAGSTQSNISGDKVKKALLPLPPFDEQIRIVQKCTELLNLVTKLENHLEK